MERTVLFKGSPMRLVGRALKVGVLAPDFRVTSRDLKDVRLEAFRNKIKVITSFPSLDTPVCDLQVKEFNKRAAAFDPAVAVIGISKDLPFAQSRFCAANDIRTMEVLSDYKYSSFGINYGLLVRELNLLARAVLILDRNDILRYCQVVNEITHQPDYDGAIAYLEQVIANPSVKPAGESPLRCVPCEGGVRALAEREVLAMSARRPRWEVVEQRKIVREFTFEDFQSAKYFLDLVAALAEEQGHHPAMTLTYGKVKVTLTTHAAGGLTRNDFTMAGIIDDLET
jgi:thiol peroxidase